MEPSKINIEMSKTDFDKFKELGKTNDKTQIENYIDKYIEDHKDSNLKHDDVLGLVLIQSIKLSSSKTFKNTLKFVKNNSVFTKLFMIDCKVEHNIVSFLFLFHNYEIEIMEEIENFLPKDDVSVKVDLTEKAFYYMHLAMNSAIYEGMTVFDNATYVSEHFLKYLYTKKTIDQFDSTFLTESDCSFVEKFNSKKYLKLGHEAYFKILKSENSSKNNSHEEDTNKKRKLNEDGQSNTFNNSNEIGSLSNSSKVEQEARRKSNKFSSEISVK